MSLTTSCTVTAYDARLKEIGKRLSLVSAHDGYVEVSVEGDLMIGFWVKESELKRAVENVTNRENGGNK